MKSKITQTDLAYFAGYIDGDGCFHIGTFRTKKRLSIKHIVSITVSSVNKPVLNFFKGLFGGSVCLACPERGNNKSLHHYTAKKNISLEIAKNIRNYLVEKAEECDLMVEFARTRDMSIIAKMKIIKDTGNLISKHHVQEFKSIANTIEPTEQDFAYLAGFIDAECCLCIQKWKPKNSINYTYKICLLLNDTKSPVFKWLMQRFGGSLCFINRLKYLKCRKNQLCWRLSGKALSKILPKIYPFLKHKRPVCEELIKFYKTTLPNGGARHTEAFRTAYAAILKEREIIVSKVHKLNLKGINHSSG